MLVLGTCHADIYRLSLGCLEDRPGLLDFYLRSQTARIALFIQLQGLKLIAV